jgi:hypothetical protein
MMWVYANLADSTDWVMVCRLILALFMLVSGIALMRVKFGLYPTALLKLAAIGVRIYLFGRSLFYWLLLMGGIAPIGSTSARLTWVLLSGYALEFLLAIVLGIWAKESPYRSDRT